MAIELAMAMLAIGVRPSGILLMGSARTSENLPRSYRWKLAWLRRLGPSIGKWQMVSRAGRLAHDEQLSDSDLGLLVRMAHDVDWSETRWWIQAIARWNRSRADIDAMGIPVHQIHGREDREFLPPSVQEATVLIRGRHLINLSLPAEVNRWIESIVRDHDLRRSRVAEQVESKKKLN